MTKRYHHLLVPLDGSELAELALNDAFSIAKLSQADVTLLQVIHPIEQVIAPDTSHAVFVDEQWQHQERLALDYLNNICERMSCEDIPTHSVVQMGLPAETIIDYAHHHPIDLIVMATHGRSGLQRWVLGSVADKMLRGADLPVLLVRAHPDKKAK